MVNTRVVTQDNAEAKLDQLLTQVAAYVESIAGKDDTLITSAGMETKGIQSSTPPDFKLEQPSSERAAFMRNPEISLFVAVPDKKVDDKYLIDLSNVVSRILTEQDGFVWVIEQAPDTRMSKYQINRGHTKGLNEEVYVQMDYVILKIRGQEIAVGSVGTYGEGLKSPYNFQIEGAGYSFIGWRGLFHLISSITGENSEGYLRSNHTTGADNYSAGTGAE